MSTNTPGGPTPPQQPYAPQGSGAYSTPAAPYGGQPGPSYGPGAPMQPGPPPAAPAKRSWFARHKILTAILAIVLLAIVINAVNGGGEDPAGQGGAVTTDAGTEVADAGATDAAAEPTTDAAVEPAAPEAAAVGTAVRDGKFEFVVTSIETGVTEVGSEFFNEQAQGQFVLVHLTVTNIGDEPQYLLDSDQVLFDAAGREFAPNSTAGIYIEGNDTFFTEINPGNTVEGTIVFDVPADAVPATLELHDSMFSGGVSVTLG